MSQRHALRPGDWSSLAQRLDELLCAHSGEEPFEAGFALLAARLAQETLEPARPLLARATAKSARTELRRLLALARGRWPGALAELAEPSLDGAALLRCAEVLRAASLLEQGMVGLDALFEALVQRAAKGAKGQFFTPRYVIDEVVRMVAPAPRERVVDPACGSGGFLLHALAQEPACEPWGYDTDPRACRVARLLLAAAGAPAERVLRADSLAPGALEALPPARRFDVVLSNPPFAGDVGEAYSSGYALARGGRVERDVLFLERCVSLLRPGGRLAVVLPHNKLAGEPWAYARRWLLERVRAVAVLSLGRRTFEPHTSQKTCVLLAQKRARVGAPSPSEEVLFFLSERDGKDARGRLLYEPDGLTVAQDLREATPLVRARFEALAREAR